MPPWNHFKVPNWIRGKKSEENDIGHGETPSPQPGAGPLRGQNADNDGRRNATPMDQTHIHTQNSGQTPHQGYLDGLNQNHAGNDVKYQSSRQVQSEKDRRVNHTQTRTYGEPQSHEVYGQTKTGTRTQTRTVNQIHDQAVEQMEIQMADRIQAQRNDKTQSLATNFTQNQFNDQMNGTGDKAQSQTAFRIQNQKGGGMQSKAPDRGKLGDQSSSQMVGQTRRRVGETDSWLTDQNRSRGFDQVATKNYPRDEEHELLRHESSFADGDLELAEPSSKCDKTEIKENLPDGGREPLKDESSSVVEIEATKESSSKLVIGSTHPGRIKNLFSGILRGLGGKSSYQQPEIEQDIQTKESRRLMNDEDLKENDIVIAVMGPTGSGKSTFVHSASECAAEGVGSGLQSYTSDVRAVRFQEQKSGRFVVLVDTPGFDDTFKSDFDILNIISNWLSSSYKKGKLLSAILYLHRITDNRVAGTSLKNLQVFRKLCGDDALEKVWLVTTMWDEVTPQVGTRRLEELKSEYWKKMISHGARTFPCSTNSSPKDLVRRIIEDEDEDTRRVLLQEEVVELQKELKETEAGRELYSHLEAIVQKQTEVIRRLNEAKIGAKDPQLVSELEEQLAELRKQMDERVLDMEKLKLPRAKRLLSKIQDPFKAFRSMVSPSLSL